MKAFILPLVRAGIYLSAEDARSMDTGGETIPLRQPDATDDLQELGDQLNELVSRLDPKDKYDVNPRDEAKRIEILDGLNTESSSETITDKELEDAIKNNKDSESSAETGTISGLRVPIRDGEMLVAYENENGAVPMLVRKKPLSDDKPPGFEDNDTVVLSNSSVIVSDQKVDNTDFTKNNFFFHHYVVRDDDIGDFSIPLTKQNIIRQTIWHEAVPDQNQIN